MEERIGSNDELAELPSAYEKWRGSALGRTTDALERELILDLIGNVAGLTVLDVGCGDGELDQPSGDPQRARAGVVLPAPLKEQLRGQQVRPV